MSSHLDRFDDWVSMARSAHYQSEKLARLADVSQRHLQRYFPERFGKSPRAWLKELRWQEEQRRLQAACDRLLRGELVKTMAFELGFKSPPDFCRKFKLHLGVTPLAWIAQQRKSHDQTVYVAFEQFMSPSCT